MEKPLVLRRKRYLKKLVDGIEIYAPDKKSLAVILEALLILQKSPSDYKNVCSAEFVIFVTRIISRDWNILKQWSGIKPTWFLDKGMLELSNGYFLASLFVHEARHVYQEKNKRLKHIVTTSALRERDACAKQTLFLARFGETTLIKLVKDSLADEYWIDVDKKMIQSYDYFSILHAELISREIL